MDAEKYEKRRVGVIVPTYDIEKILHSRELRQLVRMGITYKSRIFQRPKPEEFRYMDVSRLLSLHNVCFRSISASGVKQNE